MTLAALSSIPAHGTDASTSGTCQALAAPDAMCAREVLHRATFALVLCAVAVACMFLPNELPHTPIYVGTWEFLPLNVTSALLIYATMPVALGVNIVALRFALRAQREYRLTQQEQPQSFTAALVVAAVGLCFTLPAAALGVAGVVIIGSQLV